MSQEISKFSASSQNLNRNKAVAFVKDIQARYSNVIKNRTRNIINQLDNICIDFHTVFGDTAQPAQLLKNKTNPPPAAILTIPIIQIHLLLQHMSQPLGLNNKRKPHMQLNNNKPISHQAKHFTS